MALTTTVQAAAVAPIVESAMKKKAPSTKATVPAHPSTAVMVIAAITELKEKKGSSLSAVKKYMSTNYKVDSAKHAPFIRKFLKAAVLKGSLVQTNGNGAMGHFKLPIELKKKLVVAKKPVSKVTTVTKKPAKVSAAGVPKKRKLAVKATSAAVPSAKKPKTAAAKPKKSLIKAKKVNSSKPPKVKKTTTVIQKKPSKNK
ncbi:histone H1B, sperm-like [Myzus persicae]|uniref:histone H1B, sperm-like n=1 Tax=Myzus persicae TaxID=13164 RepID=UPI000B938ADF|nr:histone H1B, sperm-like [Myzus persicae]